MSIKKVTQHPSQNKELIFDRSHRVILGDCREVLSDLTDEVDLTFFDPPFNQQKHYASCDDNLPEDDYWEMMREICLQIFQITSNGGAIYFMQREKNAEQVFRILRQTGWTFQNLIIWKKMTSAVPSVMRYGKSFQTIIFATKGKRPRIFNRLRIDPPLLKHHKYERENGIFVTDVWDDIRELTSGYFAGEEVVKNADNSRFHRQQSPLALLLRIILTSAKIGDVVFDPFAGTGTCAVAAKQLKRNSISIEIDKKNVECIENRLAENRREDNIEKFYEDYECTENLEEIWGRDLTVGKSNAKAATTLFNL